MWCTDGISEGKQLHARRREGRSSESRSVEFKGLGNTETAGGGFNEHFRFSFHSKTAQPGG